jgi:TonB family protein
VVPEVKAPLISAPPPTPAPVRRQVAALAPKALSSTPAATSPAQDQPTASEIPPAPRRIALRIGGNIKESMITYKVDPELPEFAKRARISGFVQLMVTVDEQGAVSDINVMSGHPMLNQAAIDAVKQWKFTPTLLNGQPVPIQGQIDVPFLGPDDLMVTIDGSGNVNPGMGQVVSTKGSVWVSIAPNTPYKTVESFIRSTTQAGVQNITIRSGSYMVHQGQLYYHGQLSPSTRSFADAVMAVMTANEGKPIHLNYVLFINETGQPTELQRSQPGNEYPEFEKALMNSRVEPAILNGDPVPCAVFFRIDRN